MKKLLLPVALVVVCLVAFAQDQRSHVAGGDSTGGGTTGATPVDVMNFPMDADGFLAVSQPVANRVIDLLDDDVTVLPDDFWESEPFDTGQFTSFSIMLDGLLLDGLVGCACLWQFTDDDPFLLFTGGGSNNASSAKLTSLSNFISPIQVVNGIRGKIRCSQIEQSEGVLTDVKVLLRRE